MARITIEITDAIQQTVVKKIKDIGDSAKSSQVAVDQLNKALSGINLSSFDKAISSIDRLSKSQANLLKSQEQLAQAYSQTAIKQTKANAEDEKYKRQIEVGNLELQRRKAILEATAKIQSVKQAQAQLNLATQAEKNAIAINRQNIALQTASERLKQAELRTEQLKSASEKLGFSMFSLTNLFRAFALIKSGQQVVQLIDSYTLMENRIKLISKSTENLLGLQSELFRIANNARVPVNELTQSFVRYDYALRDLGANQRESLRFTETLSKQLAIGGLATQEQSSALLQLSQALNKGKLDGDEFRTVMETLPVLATAIAKQMGVARGELISLAPQGKITSDIIRKAMASIADETDKAFSNLAPTIGQSLTVLRNNIIKTVGEFNKITGVSEAIANGILFLSENLKILAVGFIAVASAVTAYYIPSIVAATEKTILLMTTLATNPYLLAIGGFTALAAAVVLYKDEVTLADNQSVTFGDSIKAFDEIMPSFKDGIVELTKYSFPLFSKAVEHSGSVLDAIFENIFNKEAYISGLQTMIVDTGLTFLALSDALGITDGEFDRVITSMEDSAKAREDYIKKQQESIDLLDKERQKTKNAIDFNKLLMESYKLLDPKNKGQDTSKEGIELAVQKSEDEYRTRIVLLEAYIGKDEKLRERHAQLIYDLELESVQKSAQIRNPEGFKEKLRLEKEEENVLNGIKRSVSEYATKQEILNGLLSKGNITQKQYNDELNKTSLMQEKIALLKDSEIKPEKKDFDARISSVESEGQKKIQEALDLSKSLNLSQQETLDLTTVVATKIINDVLRIEEERESAHQRSLDRIKEISEASEKAALKANEDFDKNEKKRVLGILKDLEDKKKADKQQAEDDKKAAEKAKELAIERVQITANMFGALSGLAEKFSEGRGKDAERAFKLTKALAYAEAVANTAAGVARAIKDYSFPTSLAVGISAAAAGAAQIATIKNTEMKEYAKGGIDIGGTGTSTSDSMLAYIGRGESVINAQSTKRHRSLLEAINDDTGSTSSINNTYIGGNKGSGVIVNIHNNGGNEVRQESSVDSNGQKQIDVFIDQVETRLAQKYADGNGKLAKAIDGKRLRNY